MKSLKRMLFELTMDKDFVALKFLIDRPNVFHVAGATHLETWHSRFLSWLLDPTERHMLGYYPFQRFLMAVADSADEDIDEITDIAMLNVKQFRNPEVVAEKDINKLTITEQDTLEEMVPSDDKGRLDVFFKVNIVDDSDSSVVKKLILAVEQKVYARVDVNQCHKYLRKFEDTYQDEQFLLVGLVPKSQMKETNEATFGSSSWIGIDYQQLVDIVLMPCLENPDLNIYAKPIIQQYLDALRMPYKGKREKLATIEEERILVRSLYDRFEDVFKAIIKIAAEEESEERNYVKTVVNDTYEEVFRTIKWILDEQNDVEETWNFANPFQRTIYRRWDELRLILNHKNEAFLMVADNVPDLFKNTLRWMEEQNLPLRDQIEEGIILGGGNRGNRFAIALQPIHKNRNKFASIHTYASIHTGEIYYIETKINPMSAMKTIAKLLGNSGVSVETPLLEDGEGF
ncbi:PD-(D/E)XK nuclease family protein [Bacillus tianshenii]|uniref:PD-(D/E)XK nuclease family protein n=1 Tax=Sutcliffiella tianshenii TaxID=1463404 RepID=UPI001CD217F7|nr:PD-(D/E)XK nuclease family protein [Bacillus tianshenii]MCA1318390.1 PD-(D/E)XK nuclease family protein [Bacillus tianshenii]